MDHVRLLSIQAVEHSAYTTSMEKLLMQAFVSSRLKVYNGPFSVGEKLGQAKKEKAGKQEDQNRDRRSKGREKERQGGRG